MAAWLVTGSSGFLGRHLLTALSGPGAPAGRVVALGRRRPAGFAGGFLAADLLDLPALVSAVAAVRPDVVVHAAGQTPPAEPEAFERVNAQGTAHLLRALEATGRPVRVVLVGSAAELGPVDLASLPVVEDHPCRPADAYGRSKWLATCAGLRARPPLKVVVARVFNPIGPGMPPALAFGRFAARLAEPGPDPVRLAVGDLDARRDFIDARDVADALVALALHGHPGLIYNVAIGRSRRVGDGLDALIRHSGRPVIIEPTGAPRPGPSDSRASICRITAHTGWSPRISWERSLADLWSEARARSASRDPSNLSSVTACLPRPA